MNFEITGCEYKVKYKCPLEWNNLEETEDSEIRFCNECNKNVYHCETSIDIDKHIKLNNCIAYFPIPDESPPLTLMGVIAPPDDSPYDDPNDDTDDETNS